MAEHDLERQIQAAKRLVAAGSARDSLLDFMRFTMLDAADPGDASLSRYEITPVARLLTQIMEQVFAGRLKRVAVSIGPQMGKSQVTSRGAPAWMLGKRPTMNLILGTYNQDFADEFGADVREIMVSRAYEQIFGQGVLRRGGKARDLLITESGGKGAFVGRGGSGTGKPADVFIVDDPLKDDTEAQSDATRNQVWAWFNKVAMTRCHSHSSIVVVHTRWHQDDLIGRLCDPDHPERRKKYAGVADKWTHINLPAVVHDPKLAATLGLTLEPPASAFVKSMFGPSPVSSIWPGRKSLEFLAEAKQLDPAGFSALNMGRPTPEDGDYFKKDWLLEYQRDELPKNLVKFGASDHALGEKARNDPSCLGVFGVDENDEVWVLPDLIWDRMATDRTVEEMILLMRTHSPVMWWLEKDNIARAFGPFLIKRMVEEKVYTVLDGETPHKDKMMRARAIQGRCSMRKVHFPAFAPWWPEAKKEMLNFPNGAHDDFVDFMAYAGLGMLKQHHASPAKAANDDQHESGSIGWVLQKTAMKAAREKRAGNGATW